MAQVENSVSNPTWATLVGIADALDMQVVVKFNAIRKAASAS